MSKEYILLGESQIVGFDKKEDKETLMKILGQYINSEQLEKCAKTVTEFAAEDGERIFRVRTVSNLVTEKNTKDISVFCQKEGTEFPKIKKELHLERTGVTWVTYEVEKRFSFLPGIIIRQFNSDYEDSLDFEKELINFFHVIHTEQIFFSEKELAIGHSLVKGDDLGHVDLIMLVQQQYPDSLFVFEYKIVKQELDIYFYENESDEDVDQYGLLNKITRVKARALRSLNVNSVC